MKLKNTLNLTMFLVLIVLGLFCFTVSLTHAACPDGILSYWKLEEAAAPYVDSINGNHGAAGTTAPAQVEGKLPSSFGQQFNGIDTEIDVPADGSYGWGKEESFTIEFWMKRDAPTPSSNEVILGIRDPTFSPTVWVGIQATTGFAIFYLEDGSGFTVITTGTSNISDGQWHYVVAVRDGTNSKNRIYVDNVEQNNMDAVYAAGFGSTTAMLTMGYMDNSSGFYYGGTLDEVAIYDGALSATGIQEHYNNGDGGLGPRYCIDTDNDDVSDGEENAGPNDGDGNNDGTPDSNQNTVTTLLTQDESDYVTLELVSPVGGTLSNCLAVDNPSLGDAPADTQFPFGFFEFTINGLPVAGASAELKIIFPAGTDIDTYYKYGPPVPTDPVAWYEFMDDGTTGATIANNVVTLMFVDGQRGDDTIPDSTIVDQGGPATVTAAPAPAAGGGGGGGGGGCFIATAAYGSYMNFGPGITLVMILLISALAIFAIASYWKRMGVSNTLT
jgi:hypothetical protein